MPFPCRRHHFHHRPRNYSSIYHRLFHSLLWPSSLYLPGLKTIYRRPQVTPSATAATIATVPRPPRRRMRAASPRHKRYVPYLSRTRFFLLVRDTFSTLQYCCPLVEPSEISYFLAAVSFVEAHLAQGQQGQTNISARVTTRDESGRLTFRGRHVRVYFVFVLVFVGENAYRRRQQARDISFRLTLLKVACLLLRPLLPPRNRCIRRNAAPKG